MSEKTLNTRIVHKHDIEENWLKATNFYPKQGEIIVYYRDENYSYERFKIGDGVTLVSELPFTIESVIADFTYVTDDGNGNVVIKAINTAELDTTYVPKITTISLPVENWVGYSAPYSQVVAMNGVTENSKIDLQPTVEQILELQDEDISFITENNNGVVTVYAMGGKPTSNYEMQVFITEVIAV